MLFVCADFGVAVFRATISGCSEPHSASEMRTFSLSPLPDRNGRKLHLNRAERHAGRSVSWGRYIPMGSANLSPLISRCRASFPPRGSLLQESFRTTQQGDEREQYCPPSSVSYGDSFPPRGSLFTKFLSHYTTRRRMRANRKGKPQHKMIFAISAMFTTSAMFAQCKEGFPLGGSCRDSD